jgi:hypothetical protein
MKMNKEKYVSFEVEYKDTNTDEKIIKMIEIEATDFNTTKALYMYAMLLALDEQEDNELFVRLEVNN